MKNVIALNFDVLWNESNLDDDYDVDVDDDGAGLVITCVAEGFVL